MFPAQSAASSPPTPWRISTITSLRSAVDDHVLAVGRVVLDQSELEVLLQRGQTLLELGDELAQVAVRAGGFEILVRRTPLPGQPCGAFQLLHAAADLGRLAVVVVDGRVREALLRLAI